MKNYLVILKSDSGTIRLIVIEAENFADCEIKALNFGYVKEILQISQFN